MANKTYIVTGGAGFVGSHLCERLAQDPTNTVMSVDNYFTGTKENHINGVTYIKTETSNISDSRIPKADVIFHLGEYSRVEQSFEDIELVHKYNTQGIFKILEYCRKNNVKLVYSGSSTKFADKTDNYVMSPYAWSKATNTELVKNYHLWYGIDYAISYFYNVYGPREISTGKYATLIAKFTEAARNGDDLTVVAPGTQKRNFTHVHDIVDALIMIGENGHGDEYGIGHSDAYSITEVAKMFNKPIKMLPERRGNRMSAPVLSEKTRALGWEPKENLPDYIKSLDA